MELGATLCAPDGTGIDARDPLAPFYKSTAIGRDALAAHRAGELRGILDAAHDGACKCPACGAGALAFLGEVERLACAAANGPAAADAVASQVHGTLPLPLPKKARREERRAVVALYRTAAGAGSALRGASWLLVKRPAEGLLAGQWEFPNALVAEHAERAPDDPGAAARAAAIDAALLELGLTPAALERRHVVPDEVEHIFSHVRHAMH
eukprot:6429292-Prymnesium_polylepis.1